MTTLIPAGRTLDDVVIVEDHEVILGLVWAGFDIPGSVTPIAGWHWYKAGGDHGYAQDKPQAIRFVEGAEE